LLLTPSNNDLGEKLLVSEKWALGARRLAPGWVDFFWRSALRTAGIIFFFCARLLRNFFVVPLTAFKVLEKNLFFDFGPKIEAVRIVYKNFVKKRVKKGYSQFSKAILKNLKQFIKNRLWHVF